LSITNRIILSSTKEGKMYHIRVEAEFSAAHRLVHYNGKCERFHGHNYKVRVWASGKDLGEGGMLIDFGILKSALRELLDKEFDHQDLNQIAELENDPSAERIAALIYTRLHNGFPCLPISAVDIFETSSTMARFVPDEWLNA